MKVVYEKPREDQYLMRKWFDDNGEFNIWYEEVINLYNYQSLDIPNELKRFLDKWNNGERNLRLVLAKIRADKMNKNFDTDEAKSAPVELLQAAREAVEIENPLEAEKFLNKYRLEFLESLRPMDSFSEDFVFYYGLKLKLISRIKQFDLESGETAYKNIYGSIMNGERLEVI